jgi:hypothetical protein
MGYMIGKIESAERKAPEKEKGIFEIHQGFAIS